MRHIKGAVRAACASLGIASQRLRTAAFGQDGKSFSFGVQSRGGNAAFDLLVRQPGVLGGPPSTLYEKAGLPDSLATSLDVVALYCRQVQDTDVHYAVAVRLRATGEVDVLFPQEVDWQPYATAGPRLGQFLSKQRGVPSTRSGAGPGRKLSPSELAQFGARIVAAPHEQPTLVLIEAEVWRNAGKDGQHIWPQLKNEHLANQRDELDFRHVHGQARAYLRTSPAWDTANTLHPFPMHLAKCLVDDYLCILD